MSNNWAHLSTPMPKYMRDFFASPAGQRILKDEQARQKRAREHMYRAIYGEDKTQ